MSEIVPPSERVCERCGRAEVWDDGRATWTVDASDGEDRSGTAHCLHEWDINGTFNPIAE